jgi:transcriptional regulator with XRE-family HTH domain
MSIRRWERGERLPGPLEIRALAEGLGVGTAAVAEHFDRVRRSRPAGTEQRWGRVRAPGLRSVRRRRGTPVTRIADLLGVLPATVYNWERTRVALPLCHLEPLADLWGYEVDDLLRALRTTPQTTAHVSRSALWHWRRQSGLSQQQVADVVSVTPRTLRGWERGRRPPLYAVRMLARLYGLPVATVADAVRVEPPTVLIRSWRPGDLPHVLRTLRTWSGLTQRDLAARCGCKPDTVRGWERGRAVPRRSRLLALERLYRLPSGALLVACPAKPAERRPAESRPSSPDVAPTARAALSVVPRVGSPARDLTSSQERFEPAEMPA